MNFRWVKGTDDDIFIWKFPDSFSLVNESGIISIKQVFFFSNRILVNDVNDAELPCCPPLRWMKAFSHRIPRILRSWKFIDLWKFSFWQVIMYTGAKSTAREGTPWRLFGGFFIDHVWLTIHLTSQHHLKPLKTIKTLKTI